MLVLSQNVDHYLGGAPDAESPSPPDVLTLTCMFFFLNFLAATQDIAVDGWALTMLKPHNVGHGESRFKPLVLCKSRIVGACIMTKNICL
jgi:PAT family acetyl-CoA transporter-like MFS transporter 1